MARDNSADLLIVMKLLDEATPRLKAALGTLKKDMDGVGKASDKATGSITQGFKQANTQLRNFRMMTSVAALEIAAITGSVAIWGEKNAESHAALESLSQSIKTITGDIGSIFAPSIIAISRGLSDLIPVINNVTGALQKGWTKLFEFASYGTQYWVAFAAAIANGSSRTEAMGIAANVAGAAVQDMGDNFKSAFNENTTAQVNAASDAINNLMATWMSWTDETTQGDMIAAASTAAALNAQISAYQGYYSTLAIYEDTDLQRFIANLQTKTKFMQDLMALNSTALQNITALTMNAANTWANSFGTAMGKLAIEGGKFKDAMKTVFSEMAEAFIAEVAKMTAKWMAFLALKAVGGFFGIFHAGGEVTQSASPTMHAGGIIRAHSGLAVDEVPIIAQTGEGILSRRGMDALGGSTVLASLNHGRSNANVSGSGPVYITKNYYMDVKVDRPTVSQASDVDYLVEEVSRRVAQEVERIR